MGTYQERPHTFDNVMQANGKIQEYHKHAKNDYYVVHVISPDNEIMNFSNIKPEHLEKYLQQTENQSSSSAVKEEEEVHRPTNLTFDQLVNRGGRIVSYHPTSRGNFSVHVRAIEPDGHSRVYVFTNISPSNLEKYRSDDSIYRAPEEYHPPPKQQPQQQQQLPVEMPLYLQSDNAILAQKQNFEKAMSLGGQIIDKTRLYSYSVHVRTGDNQVEHFGNINPRVLSNYESQIQIDPNFRYRRGTNPLRHNRGDTFEKIIQDPEARIVEICDHPYYTLKLRMPDGGERTFDYISEETLGRV